MITSNNIRVAVMHLLQVYCLVWVPITFFFINGIMLGAFQYFFLQKGLFMDSFLSIWIHGTIEISCIVIAGGAGIVLGTALLFPGTLSRKQSLIKGGKDALKILIGTVPLFIVAGFLESFITRLTEAPVFVKGGIIALSFILIIWYFGIYPYRLTKSICLKAKQVFLVILLFCILGINTQGQNTSDSSKRGYDQEQLDGLNQQSDYDYDKEIPPPKRNFVLEFFGKVFGFIAEVFSNSIAFILLIVIAVVAIILFIRKSPFEASSRAVDQGDVQLVTKKTWNKPIIVNF